MKNNSVYNMPSNFIFMGLLSIESKKLFWADNIYFFQFTKKLEGEYPG